MPFNLNLEKASPTAIKVALEPARNVLASMVMLTKDEDLPGVSSWLLDHRRGMTKKQKLHHTLVVIGFYHVIAPDEDSTSFPDHIQRLAQTDAEVLLQKMLNTYARMGAEHSKSANVNWKSVLASAENYITFLKGRFGSEYVVDDIEAKAYEYASNPPAMKTLIINHLQKMWDEVFQTEWARMEPILKETGESLPNHRFLQNGSLRSDALRHRPGPGRGEMAPRT